MSELKFSCPACGQHIMCSKADGGNVMQCPNCNVELRIPFSNVTINGEFSDLKAERIMDNSVHDNLPETATALTEREQKIAAERAARAVSLYPKIKPRLDLLFGKNAANSSTADESKRDSQDKPGIQLDEAA
jgi:DNA-directed RNA polymerase subunit M/transcription elongation factor TFIIS